MLIGCSNDNNDLVTRFGVQMSKRRNEREQKDSIWVQTRKSRPRNQLNNITCAQLTNTTLLETGINFAQSNITMYKITHRAIIPRETPFVAAVPTKKGYRISRGKRGRNGGSCFCWSSGLSFTLIKDTTVRISSCSPNSVPWAQPTP